ncbi:MAG: maleylpyruvate isomerase family mycothiol-dependent enzyme [Lapillicoccus sp.]
MTSPRSIDDDIRSVTGETARLLTTVSGLDPASVGNPSLCAGWTRGHVLTHLARNADALERLVEAALTGRKIPMYASPSARDGDIEAGAGRGYAEQLTDVEESAARWAQAMVRLADASGRLQDVEVEARNGVVVRALFLPFMRLREVVYHHVDLDAGYGFADLDAAVAQALLAEQLARVGRQEGAPDIRITTDEGDDLAVSLAATAPDLTVSGPRSAVLGWLARGLTDGVSSSTGALPTLPFGG